MKFWIWNSFLKMHPTCKNAKEICLKEEEPINNFLQDLRKEGKMDGKTLKELKSVGGQLPRLYRLAKFTKITFHFAVFYLCLDCHVTKLHKKLQIGYQ